MINKLAKHVYKCKCGTITETFIWSYELPKHKFNCTKCAKTVDFNNIYIKKVPESTSIRTPTRNR